MGIVLGGVGGWDDDDESIPPVPPRVTYIESNSEIHNIKGRPKTMSARSVIGIVGIALLALGLITTALGVLGSMQVEAEYKRAIGSHLSNSYDAPTFEVMEVNLRKAWDGMNATLAPEDCGRAFDWERTPDMCMAYQFQYIAGLASRIESYIARVQQGNISQFSDVYEQMIQNMRHEFNRNGPADWVAHPAWLLKYHPDYYWFLWGHIGLGFWFLLCPGIIALVVAVSWY